jgi:hypothetical protein
MTLNLQDLKEKAGRALLLPGDLQRFEAAFSPSTAKAMIQELEEARGHVKALIDGWDKVASVVNNAFLIEYSRTGRVYEGPEDFAEALEAARAFLRANGDEG